MQSTTVAAAAVLLALPCAVTATIPYTFTTIADTTTVFAAPAVTLPIDPNATPTFSVFVTATGTVPFVPEANRVFVRFKDASGIVRGSTSVAVQTQ